MERIIHSTTIAPQFLLIRLVQERLMTGRAVNEPNPMRFEISSLRYESGSRLSKSYDSIRFKKEMIRNALQNRTDNIIGTNRRIEPRIA